MFKQLPQQRKLTMAERETAKNLLELNINKKMVQDKLVANTGLSFVNVIGLTRYYFMVQYCC